MTPSMPGFPVPETVTSAWTGTSPEIGGEAPVGVRKHTVTEYVPPDGPWGLEHPPAADAGDPSVSEVARSINRTKTYVVTRAALLPIRGRATLVKTVAPYRGCRKTVIRHLEHSRGSPRWPTSALPSDPAGQCPPYARAVLDPGTAQEIADRFAVGA